MELEITGSYCEDGVSTLMWAYRRLIVREGFQGGDSDRNGDPLAPNPYPPYEIGTQEANWWLEGYRMGRYGYAAQGLVEEGVTGG